MPSIAMLSRKPFLIRLYKSDRISCCVYTIGVIVLASLQIKDLVSLFEQYLNNNVKAQIQVVQVVQGGPTNFNWNQPIVDALAKLQGALTYKILCS